MPIKPRRKLAPVPSQAVEGLPESHSGACSDAARVIPAASGRQQRRIQRRDRRQSSQAPGRFPAAAPSDRLPLRDEGRCAVACVRKRGCGQRRRGQSYPGLEHRRDAPCGGASACRVTSDPETPRRERPDLQTSPQAGVSRRLHPETPGKRRGAAILAHSVFVIGLSEQVRFARDAR